MDGDGEVSTNVPFLSNRDDEIGSADKKTFHVFFIKCILKILMWAVFLAWIALIFAFPSNYAQQLYLNWIEAGTSRWLTGIIFLLFSGPVLVIAVLAVAYIIVSSTEDLPKKKQSNLPKSRLWTFPVLVDGPLGVVLAAEFIGIMMFTVYIVWSISSYTIQNYKSLANLPSTEQSYMMLESMGFSFGQIGLFCLAFLFLPVARGSFLLRLIDIPFEQAIRYHIWLGHLTLLLFTLHGLCYLIAWAWQNCLLQEMLQWADTGVAYLAGVISLSAGLLIWVTSLPVVRKLSFELFFYTHQLYVVFVLFLAFHVGDFVFSMTAGGIFLFLLDRFLRFCQSRRSVNVVSAKCLPCGTVEIVLSKPKNLQYNALSFIFLQMRELSWLQWHPFSVSSSPFDGKNHLSVLIKTLGGWTKNLRDNISSFPEDPTRELPFLPHHSITASVEGPYGHELAYHLMYENLILVAGGIGISPFLAILKDILHRTKEKKPCLPEKILVIWAVKRSKELSLLYTSDLESICPFFSDKLHVEIQAYVTRESDPPMEDGKVCSHIQSCYLSGANRGNISGLVGTGNNTWSGIYVIIPTMGLVIFLVMTTVFYIEPFGIASSWFTGILFVACMIASVVIFGGLVVVCWDLWERRHLGNEGFTEDGNKRSESLQYNEPLPYSSTTHGTISSVMTTHYGRRPDFQGYGLP